MPVRTFSLFDLGQLTDSELFRKKASFIISIFLFLSFIFAGFFFSICLSESDIFSLTEPLTHTLQSDEYAVVPEIFYNAIFLLLVFVSGISVYGFALSFIILIIRSLSLGFTAGLIYIISDTPGAELPIFEFVASNIFTTAVLIAAVSISANYASINIVSKTSHNNYRKEYLFSCFLCILLMFISVITETTILNIF